MNILNESPQLFIIDTGADISLLKKNFIKDDILCDPEKKFTIQGITNENIKTLASVKSKILLPRQISLDHEFQIVEKNFPISCAGILGKDFLLNYKCILNFEVLTLELKYNNLQFIFDLCPENKFNFTFPSRSEKIIKLPIKAKDNVECVCPSQILSTGIYLASSIVKPLNNEALFSVININDFPVTLNELNIKYEDLNDYTILNLNSWSDLIENRLEKIDSEINLSGLNSEESESVKFLCREFNDIFYLPGDKLSTTDAVEHEINLLPNSKIVNRKPYRLPHASKSEIKNQINELLENKIIESSKSPWNSPILIVPKKSSDGNKKWRLVIDFRKLNEITISDVYPLPNITEILDQLGSSVYFSTLDLASGYYQVKIKESDKQKTAFSTSDGHFHFNSMPMGTKNSPATFQKLMNMALSGLTGTKCFVYLDDVVVYGASLEDHNKKLKDVFLRLREFNLKLQPRKCFFLRKEIRYLGHIITNSGIKPDPNLVDAIVNYPTPKNIKDVMSFLGLSGFYRQYIDNYAQISEPLCSLKKKNVKFKWDAFTDEAFSKLKEKLISAPILQYPNFENKFFITTDASGLAIGAVLSQLNNDSKDLPIAYASRILNQAEKNYPAIKKELLAIVWAIRRFRPYVYGRQFTVITDHKPLTYLYSISNPCSMLIRWRLELDEYTFDIKYRPGKQNQNADALSRIEIPPTNSSVNVVTRSHSKTDNSCESNPSTSCSTRSQLLSEKNQNIISEFSSHHKIVKLSTDSEIEHIIKDFHESTLGGHQGVIRTFNRLKKYYSFPKMISKIKSFIKKCDSCQRNKFQRNQKNPMKITSTSNYPFEKIFLDIVGPISPISHSGNKYILTMQDDLTKFSVGIPIPNQEAQLIAKTFSEHFICNYGCPTSIQTDQGSNFMSNFFKELCVILNIKKLNSTAYHPESQGALERSHRTLGEYLRNYTCADPANWDHWIPYAIFVYNSTPHSQTKYMPFELLFGHKPTLPNCMTKSPEPVYNHDNYNLILKNYLQNCWKIAKENLLIEKQKSKEAYDKNVHFDSFNEGDMVLLKEEGFSAKTKPLRSGPFIVIKKISDENSMIKIGNKEVIVHNNKLTYYHH